MKRNIESLQTEIDIIKQRIAELGDLRRGTLSLQYTVCGKPGCRCADTPPRKHGPYYQLSYTSAGKSRTRAVHREHLSTVKRQVRNGARLRLLVNRWMDLATELSMLKLKDIPK
jgi:hypothetical protein